MAKKQQKINNLFRSYNNAVCKYRWEFLRRNQDYKKDYLKRGGKNKAPRKGEWTLVGYSPKELDYWEKKYGIGYPLNPDMPFGNLKDKSTCLNIYPAVVFDSLLFENPDFETGNINFDEFAYLARTKGKGNLQKEIKGVKFSVNLFKKREDIIREFISLIDIWRRFINKQITKQRSRFEDYDVQLRIYDLRQQKKSLREIAKIVYPEEYEKLLKYKCRSEKYAVLPVTQKVNNNLKTCQKLIREGYKIIR